MASAGDDEGAAVFRKDRHVKYWLRCFKTYLPTAYTGNDANRVFLGFLIVSSLDLLGVLDTDTTPQERASSVDWIYRCQHPDGGFRGFPGSDFGSGRRTADNAAWDPANAAGTFFALAALIVLGDDLGRVERGPCLRWLRRLQGDDGGFAEMLGADGKPDDAQDTRHGYFAAAIRWILDGGGQEPGGQDIDVKALAASIVASKAYDGGIGQHPFAEPHGGYAYCGIGALSLLGELPSSSESATSERHSPAADGNFVKDVLQWLISRQTVQGDDDDDEDEDDDGSGSGGGGGGGEAPLTTEDDPRNALRVDPQDRQWAGFNGRCHKPADTCYSFWVGGAIAMLGKVDLVDAAANVRFLLERTQHAIGGFGKLPGDHPDILHSCLGLAALALMEQPGLRRLDPTLCISLGARRHLEGLPWRRKGRTGSSG